MPNVTDIYGAGGGNFLKAADLEQGKAYTVYIADAEISAPRSFKQGEPPKQQLILTLYFQDKKFGLNKTQARAIEGLYGGDYTQWVNKGIQFAKNQTTFENRPVDTILIMPIAQPAMTQEQYNQGQAWLAQYKAEQAQAAQAPAFSGPPQQFSGPPQNAFAAPPPAPVEQTGAQFTPPTFGGNTFGS